MKPGSDGGLPESSLLGLDSGRRCWQTPATLRI
jgi:hypothetical protein